MENKVAFGLPLTRPSQLICDTGKLFNLEPGMIFSGNECDSFKCQPAITWNHPGRQSQLTS